MAWFDPPFQPPLEETTQALGVCFTAEHRIVPSLQGAGVLRNVSGPALRWSVDD